MLNLTYRSK